MTTEETKVVVVETEAVEMTEALVETTSMEATKETPYLLPSVLLPLTKSYEYYTEVPTLLQENVPNKPNEPCVLGVDEAGRGPCLGPMVYAVSYCPLSRHDEFKKLGFMDSKKLTEERRDQLAKVVEANKDWVGWAVYVISPRDISTNMLKRYLRKLWETGCNIFTQFFFYRPIYNLNEMAHDATIKLIRNVLDKNINLEEVKYDVGRYLG